jgi:hypothetical protein
MLGKLNLWFAKFITGDVYRRLAKVGARHGFAATQIQGVRLSATSPASSPAHRPREARATSPRDPRFLTLDRPARAPRTHAGLRYEDLYIETADVRLALSRLPKEAIVAREQRLKRAMDLSMKHKFVSRALRRAAAGRSPPDARAGGSRIGRTVVVVHDVSRPAAVAHAAERHPIEGRPTPGSRSRSRAPRPAPCRAIAAARIDRAAAPRAVGHALLPRAARRGHQGRQERAVPRARLDWQPVRLVAVSGCSASSDGARLGAGRGNVRSERVCTSRARLRAAGHLKPTAHASRVR